MFYSDLDLGSAIAARWVEAVFVDYSTLSLKILASSYGKAIDWDTDAVQGTMVLSSSIHFWKFSLAFIFYCLVSIILYGMVGNTIIAFLAYAFSVFPAYLLGLLYFFILTVQRKQTGFVRYRKPILYFMLTLQLFTILTSPATCQSKDGEICYSFLQATLMEVSAHPNHWFIVHLFPWALLTYTLLTVAFLYTLRIEAATH